MDLDEWSAIRDGLGIDTTPALVTNTDGVVLGRDNIKEEVRRFAFECENS
jgi:hypothetical protein